MKNKSNIPGNKLTISNYQDSIVPEGFYNWYRMICELQNTTCKIVDELLSNRDYYGAKEFFYKTTKYNKEKKWQ